MAGRKLSRHQKRRINKAQQELVKDENAGIDGLVISHRGSRITVELPEARLVESAAKSNLGNIVCGDRVVVEQSSDDEYRILAIKPRNNLLQRIDGFGHLKSVAANVTQLVICIAVKPEPNLFLLDQYLLYAEQQKITPIIVLNKIDLLDNIQQDPFDIKKIYCRLQYRVLPISIKSRTGLETLQAQFDNNTSILSGVSGVGKSSITAALLPHEEIKIAEISQANEEGRHTTRTSRLYHLPNQGKLIDTPGVRGFNPVLDDTIPVSFGFREIADFGNHCRFANCRHLNEPQCAVIEALSRGDIAESRYQNYVHLLSD